MSTRKNLFVFAMVVLTLAACTTEEPPSYSETLDLPTSPYKYEMTGNDHVATLGRVLFYDKQLSINNSISCSSCHKQSLAFSDNSAFSKGFENRPTERNSMPIQNLGLGFSDTLFSNGSFIPVPTLLFWDGREQELQKMVLKPIVNHIEMGINDLDELTTKLSRTAYYPELFYKAYGGESITPERIADALSQFLVNITSNNTKFNRAMMGQEKLSAIEQTGSQLFMTTYNCNGCHQVQDVHGYLLSGGAFANIGLDVTYNDDGLADFTQNPADIGKFKIPSLRNVVLTAPYMHDGRFETLEDVMDHYSQGVEDHPNLDVRLRGTDGRPMSMAIPASDKKAIIAFLNTLTDYTMITDPRFSNPFKAQ